MTTLWDSIRRGLLDGAKMAKEGAQIAAEKAEELGKKSKVMLDISNIKRKIEKNFAELGGKTYHLLQEEKVKDIAGNAEIKSLIKSIKILEADLQKKHEALQHISENASNEK
jgi:hypothetical protein